MKILVVDDEKPALTQMQWLLEAEPLAGAVYTAANAAQAKHLLETRPVDVVLLDIHMPGQNGMNLVRELQARDLHARQAGSPERPPPQIIFITADAQPAVEAFELEARDYLLKPVRASRLHAALQRASDAMPDPEAYPKGTLRVPVLRGDSTVLVEVDAVHWVQAQGDYARLHTSEPEIYLLRSSLAELEEQWAERGFVRIHRSYLVNLHHVRRIQHREGRMNIRVQDQNLDVSRRLMPRVRERLAQLRQQGGAAP